MEGLVLPGKYTAINSPALYQGKILTTREVGLFPSNAVKPNPCVPKAVDYSSQLWFAGTMERRQAERELIERENSTFLVRHRSRQGSEYALSIKYNDEVKHIKILTKDSCFYVAETRMFKSVLDLVDFYKQNSLREGFRSLDTMLRVPYRQQGAGLTHGLRRSTGNCHRTIAMALARYGFCSRDTQELSLQVGDLVNVYAKGADGWWHGEVDGRVGWFPSTYVEEKE